MGKSWVSFLTHGVATHGFQHADYLAETPGDIRHATQYLRNHYRIHAVGLDQISQILGDADEKPRDSHIRELANVAADYRVEVSVWVDTNHVGSGRKEPEVRARSTAEVQNHQSAVASPLLRLLQALEQSLLAACHSPGVTCPDPVEEMRNNPFPGEIGDEQREQYGDG